MDVGNVVILIGEVGFLLCIVIGLAIALSAIGQSDQATLNRRNKTVSEVMEAATQVTLPHSQPTAHPNKTEAYQVIRNGQEAGNEEIKATIIDILEITNERKHTNV